MKLENCFSRREFLAKVPFILSLPLIKCSKSDKKNIVGPSGNEPENISYKYIVFRITKGSPPESAEFFRVGLYDQATKKKLEYGSSGLHGNWYTIKKVDSSKKYRIEIYKPAPQNPDCVMAFWDFTFSNDPELWRDNLSGFNPRTDTLPTGVHLGSNWENNLVTGAWGP